MTRTTSTHRSASTLDAAGVATLLGEIASRFDWPTSTGFEIAETWTSRTAFLHKILPSDGSPPFVLKVGTRWTSAKAREVYEDLTFLGRLFDSSDIVELRVPATLGWHDSPPCVCVEFVSGEDLNEILRGRTEVITVDIDRVVSQCGAALGLFHAANSFDPSSDGAPVSAERARGRIASMARRVRVDPSLVAGVDVDRSMSRRYGDFAPYNMRVDGNGQVWIIDQLSGRSYAPIHRDVSYFLDRVDRILAGNEKLDREEPWARRGRLGKIFLDAYSMTGPRPLDTTADKALLSLYLTHKQIHSARKRLRQGRISDIPRFLRSAAQWRGQASRSSFSGA